MAADTAVRRHITGTAVCQTGAQKPDCTCRMVKLGQCGLSALPKEPSHRVPPATPQQLRSAVLELSGQLESARQSLQTCEGSPSARPAQLDGPGPGAANPVQVLLGRPDTQQHSAAEEQAAAPGQAAGGGTSVVTPSSLAGSPGGDTEIEAGAVTRQQTLISTDDEAVSVADADVLSSLPTAPAETPARRGSRLGASHTWCHDGRTGSVRAVAKLLPRSCCRTSCSGGCSADCVSTAPCNACSGSGRHHAAA